MQKIRIAIADDHSIVRTGVRQMIDSQPNMEVVSEAATGHELLKQVKQLHPEVVVLDISMPQLSGLEIIPLIKDASPGTQVVMLTMFKKEAYAHQALSVGAMGYVLKTGPSNELIEAIMMANQGRYYLSPEINAEVIHSYLNKDEAPLRQAAISKYDLLSEREQQVFRLVIEGNTTRQIAEILCVSPKTAEKHRSNI
ncbi:MAG: response regulator transcription factor, partial [Desulfobulbaceae bacterium]|nr:response regulator transcription factor [Desulfobulbaceae bacterium]